MHEWRYSYCQAEISNATIVEIEREKGLQEVTILDENKEKECLFQ